MMNFVCVLVRNMVFVFVLMLHDLITCLDVSFH